MIHRDRHHRLQDSKSHKYNHGDNRQTSRDYRRRDRCRDQEYGRVERRKGNSPRRFDDRRVGRLSPPPYEPSYNSNHKEEAKERRKDKEVGDDMGKGRLEAQINSLAREQLDREVEMLISEAKAAAGVSADSSIDMLSLHIHNGGNGDYEGTMEYGGMETREMVHLKVMVDSDTTQT